MFPAPELIGAETAYKRELAHPVPRKRRGRPWSGLRRTTARRLGPTPRAGRTAAEA